MNQRSTLLALATILAVPLAAAAQNGGPVVNSIKGVHDITRTNIMATAEMLEEGLYAYRPTEAVRSMGELLAHIANAQFAFCAGAAGEQSPSRENFEETRTTKAAIIEALEAGFGYCEEVYGKMTDATGSEMVTFFGQEMARAGVLSFNAAHNYEHYGNLVTYMRMNGITPPSSM